METNFKLNLNINPEIIIPWLMIVIIIAWFISELYSQDKKIKKLRIDNELNDLIKADDNSYYENYYYNYLFSKNGTKPFKLRKKIKNV